MDRREYAYEGHIQEELRSRLRLIDDEAKPMAGTDITGRGQHQYTKLALVGLRESPTRSRYFVAFVESNFLFDSVHAKLETEDWVKHGFDQKWIYIEEVLHKPRVGETLNEYTSAIPHTEDDLWLALFHFINDNGICERSARTFMTDTYRLPKDI